MEIQTRMGYHWTVDFVFVEPSNFCIVIYFEHGSWLALVDVVVLWEKMIHAHIVPSMAFPTWTKYIYKVKVETFKVWFS